MVKCINCNDTKTIQYPDELFEHPYPACVPQPQEAVEPVNEHVTDSLKYALSASLARAGRKLAMGSTYGNFSDKLPTIAFIALDTGELIKRADGDQTNNLHIPLCRKDTAETLLVMQNPVPDVPELVRYDVQGHGMAHMFDGDYVLYSQAAEIIAAKDKEIADFKMLYSSASRGNEKLRAKLKAADPKKVD